ncbi:MAG TPA: hypothetical protein VG104_06195 [Candidatus Dormibacteraeota bacterium]|jgi:hypothetical protein|nr:hypothetical protein [Candidatus Dormibacteraeota bacterium]
MPLALQALLPFVALLAAAAVVRMRPRNPTNGWIAFAATAVAAGVALIELLRLAPGEHVDIPYLTTFPYADLAIRLDGLSLAFATITLITAALLMLARQQVRGDRREPWLGWLLTSAAVCAVIMADNLLLVYVGLQLLTLAWSGALDETAPRRRGLRLSLQIVDIGLLLAAASAIQSVGTSAFSGVPSDTFGVATFFLVLLPVVIRVGALAMGASGPAASVVFEPAIAWVAPAGYLLLRLLALLGGQLPDQRIAVGLFAGGSLVAVGLAALALWRRSGAQLAPLLLAAQAAIALALSVGGDPLFTVAGAWLWLMLIPLAGLLSVRVLRDSPAHGLSLLQLGMIPGSVAFLGLWLGGLALNARGLLAGMLPLALAVILALVAVVFELTRAGSVRLDVATAWAAALALTAAAPIVAMNPLVLPAAGTVRPLPGGTIVASLLGIRTPAGAWPALLVSAAVAALLGLALWRLGGLLPLRLRRPTRPRLQWRWPIPEQRPALPGWSRLLLWGAFVALVGIAAVRP